MTIMLVVFGYLVCSVLSWGLTVGGFTKDYPCGNHVTTALFPALFGPAGFLAAILWSLTHGFRWRLKPLTYKERYSLWATEYPTLAESPEYGEEYFRKTWS